MKSQDLSKLVTNPKDTICLNEEYARQLVTMARQKALIEADNVKLKEDNNAYFKGSGLLRIALEKAELEVFHLKKAGEADQLAINAATQRVIGLQAALLEEQKRTKRAKRGTKLVAALGLVAVGAALILSPF